jgi:hypothetical protein
MLSNAAFTFENLRLLRDNERAATFLRSIDKIGKLLNSSFRDSELLNTVLHELHGAVAFEAAGVLVKDENHPATVQVKEWVSFGSGQVQKHAGYGYEGSLIERPFSMKPPWSWTFRPRHGRRWMRRSFPIPT